MTEADEVARSMLTQYRNHLTLTGAKNSIETARLFVRTRTTMRDESVTVVDNVAYSLFREGFTPADVSPDLSTFKQLRIRPDGEPNHYALIDGSKWVAVIKLNGEFMPLRQEAIMQRILDALKAAD
jgi:hypothetical protein